MSVIALVSQQYNVFKLTFIIPRITLVCVTDYHHHMGGMARANSMYLRNWFSVSCRRIMDLVVSFDSDSVVAYGLRTKGLVS